MGVLAALIVLVLVVELVRDRRSRAHTGSKQPNDHANEQNRWTKSKVLTASGPFVMDSSAHVLNLRYFGVLF